MALLIYNKDNSALFQSAVMYLKFVKDVKGKDLKTINIEKLYDLTNLPFPDLYPYKNEDHYFLLEIEKLDSEEAALGVWDISYTWVAILNNMIRNGYKLDDGKNMFYFGLKVKPTKKRENYYEGFRLRISSWSKKIILHKFGLRKIDKIIRIEDPNFVFAHGGNDG